MQGLVRRAIGHSALVWLAAFGFFAAPGAITIDLASAQDRVEFGDPNSVDIPLTRLRPVGSPSAVDAYRRENAFASGPASGREGAVGPTRQTAMMQALGEMPARSLPPGDFGLPPVLSTPPANSFGPNVSPPIGASPGMPAPLGSSPNALMPVPPSRGSQPPPQGQPSVPAPVTVAPPQLPGSAPSFPQALQPVPRSQGGQAGSGDYAPMPPPQLDNGFATLDNCRQISAPSSYRANGFWGCGQPGPLTYTSAPATFTPPPSQIAPAVAFPATAFPLTTLPPAAIAAGGLTPILPNTGLPPLVSLGQERNPVRVGQGLFGQPTAYVPGQKFRNAIRYLTF